MLDRKTFLEHTKIFEKEILTRLENGISDLRSAFKGILRQSPTIYTCALPKCSNFDYFLSQMICDEEITIYSEYLSSVYVYDIDKISDMYVGYFEFSDEKYRFKYILEPDTRYIELIKSLYHSFILSNFKWQGIDLRDINKMYRVKIIEYIDDISLIDGMEYSINYDLDNNFSFETRIYWNVIESCCIAKQYLTRLGDLAYRYVIDINEESTYLVNSDLVEDVINYSNSIEIYSKKSDLYSFPIFKVCPFDKRLVPNYVCNVPYALINVISLGNISRYLTLYGINVVKIFKSNETLACLIIPDYNPYIEKYYSSNIYIEISKPSSYLDLYLAINILQLEIPSYRLKVYEK
ncbi:hypothetical protein [Oceanivirga salmonicida]|uniref:hypothetical protein n=1 Tax=Oceanivirga salmonicida TaxID=1769291 RepID=UPI0012E15D1E|nr:hypothetical protein [Oceanivirga salmonicida]